MAPIRRAVRRLRLLLAKPAVEREIDDEIRQHLELETAERIRGGMRPDEARAAALRAFGHIEQIKEEARDAWGGRALEELVADVRHALRGLRRSPGFAVTAVLTLALGVGATSAVFSAVHAVLLAPLPYPEPERLVRIFQQNSPTNRWTISNADWQAIHEQQRSFASVALLSPGGAALQTRSGAEWVRVGWVTAAFFRTLGVALAAGSGFRPGDDVPGAPPTVVVTEGFWRRHFGDGDPVGRTVVLDRVSYTVVGVLPGGEQRHAGVRAEVWPILQLEPPTRRGPFGFVGLGRLRAGVTLEAAARDLAGISERIYPRWASGFSDRTARLTPYPLRDVIVGDASRPLAVLAAGVGLVLLIAVANVANLVLVRALRRGREMAVRAALGARRSRLARQLLTESLVLGVLGGAAGVGVAVLGLEALRAAGPTLPRLDEAGLDLRVLAFTAAVALLSGLLAGLYPLAVVTSRPLGTSMQSGDRRSGESRGTRLLQSALVSVEFALALPLLVGAGLLLQSFVRLQRVDPGFDPANLITAELTLPAVAYAEPEARQRFWDEALRRIGEIPGVTAAGFTTSLPPDNGGDVNNFDLLERPVEPGTAEPVAPWALVTPELFDALGVPLVEGRPFGHADTAGAPPVALVSRAWAARYFPGESPLGKRLYGGGCRECEPTTIVGVVGDVRYAGLAGSAEGVYEPLRAAPRSSLHLVVRTIAAPASVSAAIRDRIRSLDPDVPVRDLAPMEERLAAAVANPRRLTWILGGFAGVAVALAALGAFGVMSCVVAQQRREIGVRLALGADAATVVRMVVRRGMAHAGVGLLVGLAVSVAGGGVLRGVLYGVDASDPLTMAAAPVGLLLVAVLACGLPGLRAARIQPGEVLSAD